MWFLSEGLVGLALFNDELDNETEGQNGFSYERKRRDPLKRATIDLELIHRQKLYDSFQKHSSS